MDKRHPGLEIGDFVTLTRSRFHLKWWEVLVWGFWHLAEMDIGRCKWQTKTLQNSISQNFKPKAHCAKMHASPNKNSPPIHPLSEMHLTEMCFPISLKAKTQNDAVRHPAIRLPQFTVEATVGCQLDDADTDTSSSSQQSPPPGSYCLCGGTQGHIFLEWIQDSQEVRHCHQAPSSALAHTCNSFLGISASW